jgi:hypothetical protein
VAAARWEESCYVHPVSQSLASIRRLNPADLPLLRKLNVLFGKAFEEPDTYGAEPPDDTYLADLLAKEHIIVLVAVAGDQVLGGRSRTNSTSSRGLGENSISTTLRWLLSIEDGAPRRPSSSTYVRLRRIAAPG